MKFTIRRTYEDKGTRGELLDEEGNHVCLTIERPRFGDHPCIPAGTYTASRYDSPKHGEHIWQLDVPDRTNIQFHIANWPHELLGCIAPGLDRTTSPEGETGVTSSRVAFESFMELTKDQEHITFEITE